MTPCVTIINVTTTTILSDKDTDKDTNKDKDTDIDKGTDNDKGVDNDKDKATENTLFTGSSTN